MTRETTPTFLLVPGAGGRADYWHLVEPELAARGYDAVAVELPAADDAAGLVQYADCVLRAVGDRRPVVLVAQSMAGFTVPVVCQRLPVDLIVLLNAMIPAPGETGGAWWSNTGHDQARRDQAERDGRSLDDPDDMIESFFHDVPPDVRARMMARGEPEQSGTPFEQPSTDKGWPDVPTRVLQGRDDRFFPPEFQTRIAQERLGITPDEIPGGHLCALSQPVALADRLVQYWTEHTAAQPGERRRESGLAAGTTTWQWTRSAEDGNVSLVIHCAHDRSVDTRTAQPRRRSCGSRGQG